MIGEIDIAGVYFSPLLACVIIGLAARMLISKCLTLCGGYRYIAWRPLFDTSLFLTLVGAAFLLWPTLMTSVY